MNNETIIKCPEVLSESQTSLIVALSWWINIFACIFVGILGLVLNLVSIIVLLRPQMWNSFFNRLMMCLSVFDSGFVLCGFIEIARHHWGSTKFPQYLFANVLYPLRSIIMCNSIYTTIGLTLERYQAIVHPIQHRNRNLDIPTGRRVILFILPVMAFSLAYYSPKFFDLHVQETLSCPTNESLVLNHTDIELPVQEEDCAVGYMILPTALRTNDQYIFWYINFSNIIVTCLIPIGILVVMNCRIMLGLKNFRQRRPAAINGGKEIASENGKARHNSDRDVKQVFILFYTVVLFIVCHALRIIMNITDCINLGKRSADVLVKCENSLSFWQHLSMMFSEFLLILNCSSKIFVLMFNDKIFQNIVVERVSTLKRCFVKPATLQPTTMELDEF